jgi:putative FmdB family regulatory protein
MPTYEYRCEKCNQTFDAFQSMKDSPYLVCPEKLCRQETWGEGTVKRLLGTGAGLIFKGSGFYITDYRSAGYKEAAKKESTASGSEAPKGGAKGGSGESGSSGKSDSSGKSESSGKSDSSGKSGGSNSTGSSGSGKSSESSNAGGSAKSS